MLFRSGTRVALVGAPFGEAAGALLCRWNASVTPAAYVSESALVCNSTARAAAAAGYVALELSTNGREYTCSARALVATPSQRLAARPRPSRVRASRAPFTCLRCSRTCVAARRLEMTRKRARKVFKRKEVRALSIEYDVDEPKSNNYIERSSYNGALLDAFRPLDGLYILHFHSPHRRGSTVLSAKRLHRKHAIAFK